MASHHGESLQSRPDAMAQSMCRYIKITRQLAIPSFREIAMIYKGDTYRCDHLMVHLILHGRPESLELVVAAADLSKPRALGLSLGS